MTPLIAAGLSGAIGRSIGTVDGARAQRLCPGGDYTDWRIGVEHVRDRWTLGLDYVGADVACTLAGASPPADPANKGDRLPARAPVVLNLRAAARRTPAWPRPSASIWRAPARLPIWWR